MNLCFIIIVNDIILFWETPALHGFCWQLKLESFAVIVNQALNFKLYHLKGSSIVVLKCKLFIFSILHYIVIYFAENFDCNYLYTALWTVK